LDSAYPFQFADLSDMDNYLQLCLDTDAPPVSVRVLSDTVMDPNDDPNPDTSIAVGK
jgi:hypothetical protein